MRRPRCDRRAIAALEFALLLPFLLMILVGIWEVGRLIYVQQVLDNAAREGARMAAQGKIINPVGAYTEIGVEAGQPSVKEAVKSYISAAGLNASNVRVEFTFLDYFPPAVPAGQTLPPHTEPYAGNKGERFKVKVFIPFQDNRWTVMSLMNLSDLSSSVVWTMMVDDPFQVDTSIPSSG